MLTALDKPVVRDWKKWTDGIVMTVFESKDFGFNSITALQMRSHIDKNYADEEWNNLHCLDKDCYVRSAMTRLARKKYLKSHQTTYSIFYSVHRDYIFSQ